MEESGEHITVLTLCPVHCENMALGWGLLEKGYEKGGGVNDDSGPEAAVADWILWSG